MAGGQWRRGGWKPCFPGSHQNSTFQFCVFRAQNTVSSHLGDRERSVLHRSTLRDAPSRAGLYNNDRRPLMGQMMTLPSAVDVRLSGKIFSPGVRNSPASVPMTDAPDICGNRRYLLDGELCSAHGGHRAAIFLGLRNTVGDHLQDPREATVAPQPFAAGQTGP